MTFKEKDFIEIDFTGRIKNGAVFDSTVEEELETSGVQGSPKPFVFCLGEGMFVKGADKFLIGKDVGEYSIPLTPEEAFGKRDPKLIQMMPIKVFVDHKINPIPGASLNFDGKIARILTVSGGRVMVDFNNPISGKNVIYDVKVLRKVDDLNEKVKAMNEFFFRQTPEFKIDGKKLSVKLPREMEGFAMMLKDKYLELLGLELDVDCQDLPEAKKVDDKIE